MPEPDDLADRITRTLEHAAYLAPAPPSNLLARIDERYNRRHSTVVALAAALAVLVVLATGIGVVRAFDRPQPVAKHPDPTSLGQIGWIRELPAKVDGESYQIAAKLPDGRFLATSVGVTGSIQRERLLLLTVPRSGAVTSRVLYQAQGRQPEISQIDTPIVNEHWIAWVVSTSKGATIYTMPTAKGGKPKAVLNVVGQEGLQLLGLGGERLYYAPLSLASGTDSLQSMPAKGGASSPVKAAAGDINVTNAHILWPWYIPIPDIGGPEGQPGAHTNYRAINLVTGETRTARFAGTYGADFCSPQWCETGGVAFNSKAVVIQRFDGAGSHAFPGFTIQQQMTGWSVFLLDRYLPAWRKTGTTRQLSLLDAKTGRMFPVVTASGVGFLNGTDYLTWSVGVKQYVLVPW